MDLTDVTLGPHTVTVSAVDVVGNSQGSAVTFTVVVIRESIKDDVAHSRLAAAFRNAGLVRSLLGKLNAVRGGTRAGRLRGRRKHL